MSDRSDAHARWVSEALRWYEQPLVRYTMRITGNLETARDVVQDAFFKLCQEDRARLDGHLAQWLYRVCRNRALDVGKKEWRMQELDQQTLEARVAQGPGPDVRAEVREECALVLEAISALPGPQQEAFRLKFEHGLTYREIGAVMDMPLSTVSYTIAQGLGTIRARLQSKIGTEIDAQRTPSHDK